MTETLKVGDTLIVGQKFLSLLLLNVDIVESLKELFVNFWRLSLIEVNALEKGVTLQLLIVLSSIIVLVAECFVRVHLEKLLQQVFYVTV